MLHCEWISILMTGYKFIETIDTDNEKIPNDVYPCDV